MFSLPPQPPWEGMHPLVIHFPIGLLFVVPVFILLAGFLGSYGRWFGLTALLLLLMGTAGAMVAVNTGDAAYDAVEELDDDDGWDVIEEHQAAAIEATQWYQGLCIAYLILFIGPFVLRKLNNLGYWLPANLIFLAALMFVNLQMAKAAHIGGRLVHQYGAKAVLAEEEAPEEEEAEEESEDVAEEESSAEADEAISDEDDATEDTTETEDSAEETSDESATGEDPPAEGTSPEETTVETAEEEMVEPSEESLEGEPDAGESTGNESTSEETTDSPIPDEPVADAPPAEEPTTE